MYLDTKLFSNVFKTLTESLVVWNCDGGFAIYEARSVGLVKACVSYKIYSVIEKINYKSINQTE